MLVKVDFEVSAWVKELMIEAKSDLDALNKLQTMTLAEIIEAGAVVDSEIEIRDARTQMVGYDLTAKVFNIEYDFSDRNMDPAVIDYLKVRLPKEQTVTLKDVTSNDDIEEMLKDEIMMITDYDVESLEYQILEEK
jgi:hypothetical protein